MSFLFPQTSGIVVVRPPIVYLQVLHFLQEGNETMNAAAARIRTNFFIL